MKKIAEILLYLWQLPQNLVGLLVFAVVRDGTRIDDGSGTLLLFSPRMRGGSFFELTDSASNKFKRFFDGIGGKS